jgi:hypothetical protein
MPQPNERYNRFMKYCAVGFSNDKQSTTGNGWLDDFDLKSKCEDCSTPFMRSQLKLKAGKIRCQQCLEDYLKGEKRAN